MSPNVVAMLRTIQNFLRLATPEERIEFASELYKEMENVESKVPPMSGRCELSDVNNSHTPDSVCPQLPPSRILREGVQNLEEIATSLTGVCIAPRAGVSDKHLAEHCDLTATCID